MGTSKSVTTRQGASGICVKPASANTRQNQPQGYVESVHRQALALYVDGINLRRIGRILGLSHQTVAKWVKAHAATLPDTPPLPAVPHQVDELDELFTFIGTKKPLVPDHPSRAGASLLCELARRRCA